MSVKSSIECVKENANVAQKMILDLKNELNVLNTAYNNIVLVQLREENVKLLKAVEEARYLLTEEESKNGINQIFLPNSVVEKEQSIVEVDIKTKQAKKADKQAKPKKEKKLQELKGIPDGNERSVDVGHLDLRIAKIDCVQKHPDADGLYVLKVNCGKGDQRTVCSGLVKYIPIEELQNRYVVLLCNLKPVKMRGVMSEGMVMCASTPEKVEVLSPPDGCLPGDHVHCDGYIRQPDTVMNPKKKIFERISPDLHTDDVLRACYRGTPFNVPNKGFVVAKTLKNVAVK